MSEDGILWTVETGIWKSRGRGLMRKFSSIAKSLMISKDFKGVSTFSKQLQVYVQKKKKKIFVDCLKLKDLRLKAARKVKDVKMLSCVTSVTCLY